MKKQFPFSAHVDYAFDRVRVEICAHCNKLQKEHADGSCLFEASEFRIHELKEFFDYLIRHGGVLTLTSGPFTLTQKIGATVWDRIVDASKIVIQAHGPVELENAKKR